MQEEKPSDILQLLLICAIIIASAVAENFSHRWAGLAGHPTFASQITAAGRHGEVLSSLIL